MLASSLMPFTLAIGDIENAMDVDIEKTSLNTLSPAVIPFTILAATKEKSVEAEATCQKGPHAHRISIRHQEGSGVGFREGYSSVDAFLTLFPSCACRPFIDLRGHYFNDGKWAANAGLGLRKAIKRCKAVAGANLYYDFRDAPHSGSGFHQIGPGVELLFDKCDLRANAYITIGKRTRVYQKKFTHFAGHNAFFLEKKKQAMHGGDIQIGGKLLRKRDSFLHAAVGGYYFRGRSGRDAIGGMVRATAQISPYFTIEGQGSYDTEFKGRGWGSIAVNIPFGGRIKEKTKGLSCETIESLQERFVEQVPRFEILVVNTHRKKSIGLNPATGLPINFIFVDNMRGSSDGSFENPYATLVQAQNNSQPGDFIYVFPGDGTARGIDHGITLKNNQVFTSSAVPLQAETSFGVVTIPAQTVSMPKIAGLDAVAAVMLNNTTGVTVQGFEFNFIGTDFAVIGNNASNLIIAYNSFPDSFADGIHLTNSNNIRILSNQFTLSSFSALSPVGASLTDCRGTVDFKNNAMTGTATGFHWNNSIAASIHGSLTDNVSIGAHSGMFDVTLSNCIGTCEIFSNVAQNPSIPTALTHVIVDILGTSHVNATIRNNTFTSTDTSASNQISGIQCFYSNTSTGLLICKQNTMINMGDHGINLSTFNSAVTTLDVIENGLINVNLNKLSTGGMFFGFNGSSTTLKLCNNASFTNPASSLTSPGFLIDPADMTSNHLQSPDGTLSGLAAINPGSTNGGDVPPGKIGAITINNPSRVVFDTVSPFNCEASP